MSLPDGLPSVLWLGGGSGAGKTTISRTIALRFDLAWYRIDAYAYEHQDRLVAKGAIERTDEDHDQRWLAPTPEELARQFIRRSEQGFPLILDDLRSMGTEVGVAVEGPHLFPSLVAPYLSDPGQGLWLLPTEEFQRRALESRAGDSSKFTSDPARAFDKRVRRNQLLDARIREEAKDLELTIFEVDGSQDLPTLTERVSKHFAGAISAMPAAGTGERRRRMRQFENDAMMRNVYAFLADLAPAAPPERPLPFSCECMQLGCESIGEHTRTEYERLRAAGLPVTAHPYPSRPPRV